MPETPHYAFKYTLSPDCDILATWTEELLNWARANCVWYALKHEVGENGKLHIHFAFVIEIQTSTTNGGAKTGSNVKRTIANAFPNLKEYLIWSSDHISLISKRTRFKTLNTRSGIRCMIETVAPARRLLRAFGHSSATTCTAVMQSIP